MQQRKIYLVDTENIGGRWMTLCETCSKNDKIVLFHTNEAMKFTFEDMRYLQPYMTQIHMIHCYNGTPNALDFQLCAVMAIYLQQIKSLSMSLYPMILGMTG